MAIYQGKSSLNHMNGQLDIFIFFTIVNLQVIKRKKLPAALRLAFHDCVGELLAHLRLKCFVIIVIVVVIVALHCPFRHSLLHRHHNCQCHHL